MIFEISSAQHRIQASYHIVHLPKRHLISSSPSRVTLSEVSSFQLSLCCGMAVSPFSSQIAAVQIDGTVVVDGKTSLSSTSLNQELREGVKLHPSTLTRDPVIHQIPYHSVDFGSSANVVMTACGH
ncbi:hypothetical protein BLNAU_7867 [Blattamonas nauphoetae]|uniref:Uncharacterized protein n=1 Tax=Blattamonas nauphoetae TaxID=2049346 RepID=A0ABQ9XZW1_9EUKA|nr:hypothetical protein BLNAU_7867 [Blattamonas nauphoetae]